MEFFIRHRGKVSFLYLTVVYWCLVPMMVPKTTAETLKHKINPSLELAAPQAVDVLLYTPGMHTHAHAHTFSQAILSVFILSL